MCFYEDYIGRCIKHSGRHTVTALPFHLLLLLLTLTLVWVSDMDCVPWSNRHHSLPIVHAQLVTVEPEQIRSLCHLANQDNVAGGGKTYPKGGFAGLCCNYSILLL